MPFSYELDLKRPVEIKKYLKGKIYVENEEFESDEKLEFKLYFVNSNSERFLLAREFKKFKGSRKIKFKCKYKKEPALKITKFFHIELEIIENSNIIDEFSFEEIEISLEGIQKYVKFSKIDYISREIIPNCSFVFWVESIQNLPINHKFNVDVEIIAQDGFVDGVDLFPKENPEKGKKKSILASLEESFSLGPNDVYQDVRSQRIPISILIPDFKSKKLKADMVVKITDKAGREYLDESISLKCLTELRGIRFEHVGFKRNIELGELATIIVHISNDLPSDTKGKAEIFYFSTESGKLFEFKRKFKMREGNYEKLSEDSLIPLSLAGRTYWVVCDTKLKSNSQKIKLQGLSEPRLCKIPEKKSFNVELRPLIREEDVYYGSDVSIEVNVRIETRDFPDDIECKVFQNIGNKDFQRIHSFDIEDRYDHSSFHWKVPKNPGPIKIEVVFEIQGVIVSKKNIDCEILEFEPKPRP